MHMCMRDIANGECGAQRNAYEIWKQIPMSLDFIFFIYGTVVGVDNNIFIKPLAITMYLISYLNPMFRRWFVAFWSLDLFSG